MIRAILLPADPFTVTTSPGRTAAVTKGTRAAESTA